MTPKRLPADLSAWPKDPMTVLGIRRGADRAAVRRAYTALLREFNPEHYPEHFRRIREAYEIVLRQVEASETWKSQQQDALPDAAPFDFDSTEDDETIEHPDAALTASLDKPPARRPSNPAAQLARWHDDLDAIWNRAVARDETAYRALVEMEARFTGRRDLCLRLYWLLVAWPELDARRKACDWLARGLRLGGLSGPLAELYRRELEEHPEEAVSERCTELLDCEAQPVSLAGFVEARWRAAGRLDQFELIADDLERLRVRLQADEEIWGRLVLAAINEICWSSLPEVQALAGAFWLELEESAQLHTRFQISLDRTETIRLIAVGWNLLRGARGVPEELLRLVRLSVLRPADEVAPQALELLHRLLTNDRRLLALFDQIHKASPAVLAQISQIISLCGGAESPQPRNDADQIRALARFEIESNYCNSYEALRPYLLDFCVREQVSPETLLRMPNVVLVQPDSANAVLVRSISADAPLRLVYLAHRALGA
jgi:hypothetical protein